MKKPTIPMLAVLTVVVAVAGVASAVAFASGSATTHAALVIHHQRHGCHAMGMMGVKGPFAPAMLARMGSSSKVTFSKAGVYKLTTRAGEDYMSGVKTIGDDNVLKLTVTVS